MATLTKANYVDVIDIILSKACTISADKESKVAGDSKTINLEVNYKGLTFKDLMAKALKGDIIAWQNGGNGRKNYDKHIDGSTVKINATSPGAGYVDFEEKYEENFVNKSRDQQLADLAKLAEIAGIDLKV
jgi:hypothetical protein